MAFRLITLLVTMTWLCAATAFITQDMASRVIILLSALLIRELTLFKSDLDLPEQSPPMHYFDDALPARRSTLANGLTG